VAGLGVLLLSRLGGVHVHSSLCFADDVYTKSSETWLLSALSLLITACRKAVTPQVPPVYFCLLAWWLVSCVLFVSLRCASPLLHREAAGLISRLEFALQPLRLVRWCESDRGQKHAV